jgi:hypothetical protein
VARTFEYPSAFDLKVAFRQHDGSLALADRAWRGKTPGIYMIRNLSGDGGAYVGESGNIIDRWLQHQRDLKSGKRKIPALQAAWDAHGAGIDGVYGFEWIVLEILPEELVSWTERCKIEKQWMRYVESIGPLYNSI